MAKQEVVMTEAARSIASRSQGEDRAKYQARIMRQLDRFYRMGVEAGQELQKRRMEGQDELTEKPMANEPPRMNRRDLLSIMTAVLYTSGHPPEVAVKLARKMVKEVDKSYGIPLERVAELFMIKQEEEPQ